MNSYTKRESQSTSLQRYDKLLSQESVMLKVELNRSEYNYLCQASFLDDKQRKLLFSSEQTDDRCLLKISEDQADEIRDLCGEQLQIIGFDEKYELTWEGKVLESLVDKFFVG